MYCHRDFAIFLCRHALLQNKELHILFYAVGLNYGVCRNVVVWEHGPGSGDTPGKPGNKMSKKPQGPGACDQCKQNIRKTLFGRGNPTVGTEEKEKPKVWCSEEMQALIQYIGLYWDGTASNGWPNTKDEQFWECCANAIAETTNLPKRSGKRVYVCPLLLNLLLIGGM